MRRRGVFKITAVFSLLAAFSLFAAACGSSNKSSSTKPASSSAASSFDLAAVKARVDAFAQGPTKYEGPTEAVTPKKGIKLAIVPCSEAIRGCVRPVEEAGKIAKELGWSVKSYDGKATPKDNNNAVQQAVAGGADVVLTGGVDPSFIAGGFRAAQAKKVLVASMSQGVAPSANGYPFDIGADYTRLGTMVGDWIVADSGGKAVMLPFDDKSFASALAFVKGSVDAVDKCPDCNVLPRQYFVGTDIATGLGPRAVDAVRKNPKITYIQGDYDPAVTAIVPAIANAGLKNKVKVVGGLANQQNLEYVKAGNVQHADAGFDNRYMGYMAIYQVNRLLNGQKLWETPGESRPEYKYSGNVPERLFSSDHPPASTKDYVAEDTMHYEAPMRKLLGLG
jgi:ABC-type sugar transport system substrate-binding protein